MPSAIPRRSKKGQSWARSALAMARADPDAVWLALAVLTGTLPDTATVLAVSRAVRLDGVLPALSRALAPMVECEAERWPEIEVITGQVVVDLHHTSETEVATGIQRVVRETAGRWHRDHGPVFVGWTEGYTGLRRLSNEEQRRALFGVGPAAGVASADPRNRTGQITASGRSIIVPWRCTVLIPELAAEPARALRYQALAAFCGSETGFIGYDCVPLMASETSGEGMPGAFALYLAAAAKMDRVAAISDAAATEYRGWVSMLAGSGRRGPSVHPVPLTVESATPDDDSIKEARELLCISDLPMVLVVGSHEPRKNHLAMLRAAEVLWQEGVRFSLSFVGGHSWKSQYFAAEVEALQALRRPVQIIRALSDRLLWAAYKVAYCTAFVSVHEGYGLPIAESLASGTPVVASNLGSMRELASRGGALTVDPSSHDSIADALRRLLRQPALRDRLAAQASSLRWRTWDEYAAEVWTFLVAGGGAPGSQPV